MKKNADYAIALKVRKIMPGEKIDESCSKFYGAPTLPESLLNNYPDDCVFFLQINCEELKDLDPDNRLPHEGYLYFFLDAEMYPCDDLYIFVDYTLEEPKYTVKFPPGQLNSLSSIVISPAIVCNLIESV